jgi:FMN-dependent NADH-azoreductase
MMSNLLLLECSPHGENSLGTQLVREAVGEFQSARPDVHLVTRTLAVDRLCALSGAYARGLTEPHVPTSDAFRDSEQLIGELEQSAFLLISTPVHNFGVPSALKLWIDHVVREDRTFK